MRHTHHIHTHTHTHTHTYIHTTHTYIHTHTHTHTHTRYKTGHFGKLVNDQNYYWCPSAGDPLLTNGFTHISTSCESTGAFWATDYVVKDNDTSPVRREHLDVNNPSTYSTAQFGNRYNALVTCGHF